MCGLYEKTVSVKLLFFTVSGCAFILKVRPVNTFLETLQEKNKHVKTTLFVVSCLCLFVVFEVGDFGPNQLIPLFPMIRSEMLVID